MPKFYVLVEFPHDFDDGGEGHDICWGKLSPMVVTAKTAEKAVAQASETVPALDKETRELLDKEYRGRFDLQKGRNIPGRFEEKKGFIITVKEMTQINRTAWQILDSTKTDTFDV